MNITYTDAELETLYDALVTRYEDACYYIGDGYARKDYSAPGEYFAYLRTVVRLRLLIDKFMAHYNTTS
jgi:hypothetical protein